MQAASDTDLLDDVRAELLHGKRTDVASELPNDGVTETIIIKIQDVLHNLRIDVREER